MGFMLVNFVILVNLVKLTNNSDTSQLLVKLVSLVELLNLRCVLDVLHHYDRGIVFLCPRNLLRLPQN